ncbi:MAG: pyridoxamine 5'-phosphate oxidase family protein [Proteobacteria bacterium]|nr:pyridoxamine 5'-phosphate oxidase family protein [Pseudomonadota bacterium]MBU4471091.1 pyridoxamine 5'-phosphate oxidase family protein [Pseudomonadota bacterium]MCG2750214.1 pyridoxamine 5'-phosphate oxidase family protein [Desulfobacteraceae bacterium]
MEKTLRHEFMEKIASLLGSQKLAVLSTFGKEGPYANLIAFAETEDLKTILFATPKETVKYENMKKDNRVALLVENTKNHEDDFQNARAVTAMGRVDALKGEVRSMMVKKYLVKHPNLKEFVNSTNCAFMQVKVEAHILVESLQKATRISMKD